jgi:hypothetical protein
MKMIASDNFHVPGVPRLVRAGELIEARPKLARQLAETGLAVPAKRAAEFAVRRPRENAMAPRA